MSERDTMAPADGFRHAWHPPTRTLRIVIAPAWRTGYILNFVAPALVFLGAATALFVGLVLRFAESSIMGIWILLTLAIGTGLAGLSMVHGALNMIVHRCGVEIDGAEIRIRRRTLLGSQDRRFSLSGRTTLALGPLCENRQRRASAPNVATGLVLATADVPLDWFAQQLQGEKAEALLHLILERFPTLRMSEPAPPRRSTS